MMMMKSRKMMMMMMMMMITIWVMKLMMANDPDQLEDLSDQLEKMNLVWGTAVITDLKTSRT